MPTPHHAPSTTSTTAATTAARPDSTVSPAPAVTDDSNAAPTRSRKEIMAFPATPHGLHPQPLTNIPPVHGRSFSAPSPTVIKIAGKAADDYLLVEKVPHATDMTRHTQHYDMLRISGPAVRNLPRHSGLADDPQHGSVALIPSRRVVHMLPTLRDSNPVLAEQLDAYTDLPGLRMP